MKPRVLVIGGGFLGKALAEKLALDGSSVEVVSPRPIAFSGNRVRAHTASIEDEGLLDSVISHCDTVVHTASATTPGSSVNDPVLEARNVLPTLHLLKVMQNHPAVHLIYLSSGGCVYGDASAPSGEERPLSPKSYHGAGKVAAEAFLKAFRARNPAGRGVTVLRPSNLYGPGQPLRVGFGVVRTLLEKIKTDAPFEIWGDGEGVRDFLYIDDLVDVCGRIIDRPTAGEIYNVGFGVSYSINQLVDVAQRVCNKRLQVRYMPGRRGDVRNVTLDYGKLRSKLNWTPNVSLEEGIARTWRWLLTP